MNVHRHRVRGAGIERTQLRGRLAWFWVAFWLIFLVQPVTSNIADGGTHTVGASLLVLGGAIYMPCIVGIMRQLWSGMPRTREGQAGAGAAALGVSACMLSAAPLLGQSAFALLPYAVVIFAMGMGRALGMVCALCLVAATVSLSSSLTGRSVESGLLFAALASGLAAGLGAYSAERTRDAEAAREDAAMLRVQDERNRMARDLHDILGHSLTVVTMKAELAGKLVDVDAEAAKRQIAEVEQLARGALADVRTTVAGYREMSLSGEIARARRAFTDAGITASLPAHVDEVMPDLRELFAWGVREATTNILRHSGATRVTVELTPTRLTVRDDGRGAAPGAVGDPLAADEAGSGLVGLRERAHSVGAVLTTSSDAGGFTLSLEAPPVKQAHPMAAAASPREAPLSDESALTDERRSDDRRPEAMGAADPAPHESRSTDGALRLAHPLARHDTARHDASHHVTMTTPATTGDEDR